MSSLACPYAGGIRCLGAGATSFGDDEADADGARTGVGTDYRPEIRYDQRVVGSDGAEQIQELTDVARSAVGHAQPADRRKPPHLVRQVLK